MAEGIVKVATGAEANVTGNEDNDDGDTVAAL